MLPNDFEQEIQPLHWGKKQRVDRARVHVSAILAFFCLVSIIDFDVGNSTRFVNFDSSILEGTSLTVFVFWPKVTLGDRRREITGL